MTAKTSADWNSPVGEPCKDSSWFQRERGGLTHWLPSTHWREVCFNGHRSSYDLLESFHTQSHLPCLPVVSFPSRYFLPTCFHPFGQKIYLLLLLRLSTSIPEFLLSLFPGYFVWCGLQNLLVLPEAFAPHPAASQYLTLGSSRPGLPSQYLIQYASPAALAPISLLLHSDGVS